MRTNNNKSKSKMEQKILNLVKDKGIIRPRDLKEKNIPVVYLTRLCRKQLLKRVGRGLYTKFNAEPTAFHSYAIAAKRIPKGVICLLSALQFHELGSQQPFEVWVAFHPKARKPDIQGYPIRVVRFSGSSLTEGFEQHKIDGVTVRVFNIPKTIADCFKYRNKIGLEVALEALQEAMKQQLCSIDDIWHYAKICRVSNIIRPYIESLK